MHLYCLAKFKFDLRDPDEVYLAQKEFDALLETKSRFIKTLAFLIKEKPFNQLDDEVIHLITRLPYLGEGQGVLSRLPVCDLISIIKRVTFFREIYVIFEAIDKQEIRSTIAKIGLKHGEIKLDGERELLNPYTSLFLRFLKGKILVTIRFIPFHTLFEYAVEVKKLPAAVFRPKNGTNWKDYFNEKEEGVERGIRELIEHMQEGGYRSPHFGLGKNHIGDFVDWASTDLRKPFLHYLHKLRSSDKRCMSNYS